MLRVATAVALVLAGCGGTPDSPDARPRTDATADATCDARMLPMHELPVNGRSGKLYIEVLRADATRALFLVDTGSQDTFLQLPLGSSPQADAGVVRIGCDDVHLPGYAEYPLGTVDGLAVIGTIGVDRFLGGPTLVDVEHAVLSFSGPFPAADTWPSAPFDLVQRVVLAHVTLEGADVRLLVDTGATDSLWLGQPGEPGDTPIETVDSAGNPLTLYLGTGDLAIGGVPRTVPLVRAPSFPYLEDYVAALGGNIAGLLGVSSFAHALVIDPAAGEIRVEP